MKPTPQEMTFQDAETEILNSVYAATVLIEWLEHAGKVRGNGHHIRQEVAAAAAKILKERWIE